MSQNMRRFYFATIPVDDLFPWCFVARRDEEPDLGFQRALNQERADDIASYLSAGDGSIPSNIVLSAQQEALFGYDRRTKTISFTRIRRAFLVLDGQHRLWGYQKSSVRHRVPVAIYDGLSRSEETKLFIDINTNQRGVPAALLLDIKQLAAIETGLEIELRSLFDRLNKDASSPLRGKLSAARSVSGRISRVTFNRALTVPLRSGVLSAARHEARVKLIINYLSALDAELKDKSLLTRRAYFEAIFEVMDEVVRNTIAALGDAKREALQRTLAPLARLDMSDAKARGASLAKGTIVQLLQAALRKDMAISDEML